jgi:hypothetical protein
VGGEELAMSDPQVQRLGEIGKKIWQLSEDCLAMRGESAESRQADEATIKSLVLQAKVVVEWSEA